MDLSGYNKNTILGQFYDNSNKEVVGKFSDEKPQAIIKEVVAPDLIKCILSSANNWNVLNQTFFPNHMCNDNCRIGHSITAKGVSKFQGQQSIKLLT